MSRFLLLLLTAPTHASLVSPYPNGRYNPEAARSFFSTRPLEVAARGLELVGRSAGFGLALLSDAASGTLATNADERAADLATLLTTLGPTFIKAGQSASIRTDLLPPAYIRGLTQLQDQVPAFGDDEARKIISEELGGSFPFASLSDAPVAAASLGQVYRGKLPNGTEVAVKVQRPNVERQIALDMLLIREVAARVATWAGVPGDLIGTADAWGAGFVDELDYAAEATNAERFNQDLARSPLSGRVFAPAVVHEASRRRVLTTVWVTGERLDKCAAPEDVPRLCSVAMNTYLEMMLDTGVLHCDPHPGNLLRTPDGQLCILDWGLVTSIRPDLQLTLIEHVAHLVAKDYGKVPSDLVKLGFVPAGDEEAVVQSGVVDFLTYTYSTWSSGGGAAKLDVPALFDEVRTLAADSEGGMFQVPPYFAYIAKSFSVLEGIGLTADPEYSIIDATLPYISKRIMTDPSPRTAGALETFIFPAATKGDAQRRVVDAERVETLVDGARRYAADTRPSSGTAMAGDGGALTVSAGEAASGGAGGGAAGGALGGGSGGGLVVAGLDVEEATDAIFDVLLAPEPSPLQAIILEQLALVLGAASREAFATLRSRSGRLPSSDRSRLGALLDPLGLFRGSPLVSPDARDRAALDAAAKLAEIARSLASSSGSAAPAAPPTGGGGSGGGGASRPTAAELQRLVSSLTSKVWTRRAELRIVSRRLAAQVLDQTSRRVLSPSRSGALPPPAEP